MFRQPQIDAFHPPDEGQGAIETEASLPEADTQRQPRGRCSALNGVAMVRTESGREIKTDKLIRLQRLTSLEKIGQRGWQGSFLPQPENSIDPKTTGSWIGRF